MAYWRKKNLLIDRERLFVISRLFDWSRFIIIFAVCLEPGSRKRRHFFRSGKFLLWTYTTYYIWPGIRSEFEQTRVTRDLFLAKLAKRVRHKISVSLSGRNALPPQPGGAAVKRRLLPRHGPSILKLPGNLRQRMTFHMRDIILWHSLMIFGVVVGG